MTFDQATGSTRSDDSHTDASMGALADEDDPAYFYAVDGQTAYWRDERGAVAVDAATGATRVVDPEAANGFDIVGAGSGLLAFGRDEGIAIGTSPEDARRLRGAEYASDARFSPDGTYVNLSNDALSVYEVGSGDRVPLDAGSLAVGYEWLDADSLVVLTFVDDPESDRENDFKILTCSATSGECETAMDKIGSFDAIDADGALPTGEVFD